jgi:hypothetical protein
MAAAGRQRRVDGVEVEVEVEEAAAPLGGRQPTRRL